VTEATERQIDVTCGKCGTVVRVTYIPGQPFGLTDHGERVTPCLTCREPIRMQFHGEQVDDDFAPDAERPN
jgi:hypothetical protein